MEPESHEFAELMSMIVELRERVSKLEASEVPVNCRKRPTVEQAREYGLKIELPVDEVDNFLNHYEANGWKVGRNPMKSWQAAMVNWKKTWKEGVFRANGNGNASIFGLKAALEVKVKQAKNLQNTYYDETPFGGWTNQEARQNFIALKKEIKALEQKITQCV